MLLPPDLRDWLPRHHVAYFILDVVGELDLSTDRMMGPRGVSLLTIRG